MAKAAFDEMIKKTGLDIISDSCGISAAKGVQASENAVKACEKIGLDSIKNHKSKPINNDIIKGTDLFAVMTMSHAMALINMGVKKEKIYILNIADPFGGNTDVYEGCLEQINEQLIILIELIKRQENKA